jgi:hypothetical protein
MDKKAIGSNKWNADKFINWMETGTYNTDNKRNWEQATRRKADLEKLWGRGGSAEVFMGCVKTTGCR